MLFNTHVKMGSLLHTWFVDSFACRLLRQAFLYGNIKPDLERRGWKDRHLLENARGWISQRVALLREEVEKPVMERDAIRASVLAGEICHHVSDAFCLYHDDPSRYPVCLAWLFGSIDHAVTGSAPDCIRGICGSGGYNQIAGLCPAFPV